jgi:hypothetical protein
MFLNSSFRLPPGGTDRDDATRTGDQVTLRDVTLATPRVEHREQVRGLHLPERSHQPPGGDLNSVADSFSLLLNRLLIEVHDMKNKLYRSLSAEDYSSLQTTDAS